MHADRRIARASSVAVAPDGLTVLAVGTDDDAVISLRRDPATSALTRVSCVSASAATAGCTAAPLIQGPRGVIIRSPADSSPGSQRPAAIRS